MRTRPRHVLAAVLLVLAGLVPAACGGSDAGPRPAVVLSLDFIPNAIHAPIYTAVRTGRDRREGIRLQIRKPGAGPDALKLVASGRVDLGVLDIHDLAIARQRGIDLVGIGALVGRPLAALIARPGIARPRDLEGHTVGVSGLPSDPAFLKAILQHDGADDSRVRQVTIGFNAVGMLFSRRVDAVPAFWNAEGVALEHKGVPVREFRVDDYGAPPYPEVILMTSRKTLATRRDRLRRALAAIGLGLRDTLADPQAAARQIAHEAQTPDIQLVRDQLRAVTPVFARGLELDRRVLERWADFDARIGIVGRRPDVRRAFDFSLLVRR